MRSQSPLPLGEGWVRDKTVNLTANDRLDLTRQLRGSSTDAENKLWAHLRNRQLYGLKFKRRVPVCGFIADFLCDSAKLIVEVDGGQHALNAEQDLDRTKVLESAGFQVVRLWNNDVMSNIEGALSEIANTARLATAHPVPLPRGEGTSQQPSNSLSQVRG
jgi:very-short-patch-repair endonuclease